MIKKITTFLAIFLIAITFSFMNSETAYAQENDNKRVLRTECKVKRGAVWEVVGYSQACKAGEGACLDGKKCKKVVPTIEDL